MLGPSVDRRGQEWACPGPSLGWGWGWGRRRENQASHSIQSHPACSLVAPACPGEATAPAAASPKRSGDPGCWFPLPPWPGPALSALRPPSCALLSCSHQLSLSRMVGSSLRQGVNTGFEVQTWGLYGASQPPRKLKFPLYQKGFRVPPLPPLLPLL